VELKSANAILKIGLFAPSAIGTGYIISSALIISSSL
jgi:hypothetical protein